jgi:hypothetical protein
MTIGEAVSYIRMLLDESGIEAHTDASIVDALMEASVYKAREYYRSGEKEAIRNLYREDTIASPGTASETIMNIEACLLKTQSIQVAPMVSAVFVPFEQYRWKQYPNPSKDNTISGRAEFSYHNDTVYHNGLSALIGYYKLPTARGLAQQIELAEYTHPAVVDYAAASIYTFEVPDADHGFIGKLYDIESILQKIGTMQ